MFQIPEKTHEEKIRDQIIAINEHSRISAETAKANYYGAFDMLWNPPYGTPQDICDGLGSQAYKLFENAMTWIGVIVALDPSWQYPPAPNEFTINHDGTVTIGEPINPEE